MFAKCTKLDVFLSILSLGAGLAMLISAIYINVTVVNRDIAEANMYQWKTCNTTAFRLRDTDLTGIATYHTNTFVNSCEWIDVPIFSCNSGDDSGRCVIEQTNRYNNPKWMCMLRVLNDDQIDCSIRARSDSPSYTAGGYYAGMCVLYVFGCLTIIITVGLWLINEDDDCCSYQRIK